MYYLKCFNCQKWFTAEEVVSLCPDCEVDKSTDVSMSDLQDIVGNDNNETEDLKDIDEVIDDPVDDEPDDIDDDGVSMDDL